jgi:acetyl/propionyl-CoA carboxylase alpha subunit
MTLDIILYGREHRLELLAGVPACRFRLSGGPERAAHVVAPVPGIYSVLMDGLVYDVWVEEAVSGLVIVIDGYRFEAGVCDPRRYSRQSRNRGPEGIQGLRAPMPGKVVRVLAAPGDAVEAGQGVIVVEAMKMQNELKAPRAGRVLSIAVKEGAIVAAGDVLATIE